MSLSDTEFKATQSAIIVGGALVLLNPWAIDMVTSRLNLNSKAYVFLLMIALFYGATFGLLYVADMISHE